jgi:tetratricopeptide (TPR) repeat protein
MMRAVAIAVALAALAPMASAAEQRAGGDRPGRALFDQAEAKFNVGRFDEALADYQAAYDVEPLPAFLFNIGQCHRNLGNYDRAQFFFRRYTVLEPHSPNRPAAERLIAEMEKLAGERALAERERGAPALSLAAPAPAAGEQPARVDPASAVADKRGDETARPPLHRRAWFWVAVSGIAVGGVVAAYAIAQNDPRSSSLRPIDTR